MANIVISAFSNCSFTEEKYTDCFTEQFINALSAFDNKILYIQCNGLIEYHTNKLYKRYIWVKDKIKKFSPDLFITYNNVLPGQDIPKIVDCPILLYPCNLNIFWNQREQVKDYLDQYYFLCNSEIQVHDCKRMYKVGDEKIVKFGHATEIVPQNIVQNIPISFVGSIGFFSSNFLINYLRKFNEPAPFESKNKRKKMFFKAFDNFCDHTNVDINFNMYGVNRKQLSRDCIMAITCKKRVEVLSSVTDLGLKIFGFPDQWAEIFKYNYQLFRAFDYRPSITYAQNSLTYNRSKISLNLPHGNSGDGLSWRVCDILASNSVLLSPPKKDLLDLMKGYTTLPTYTSPAEARELSIKLLKDKKWRKALCEASQQIYRRYYWP